MSEPLFLDPTEINQLTQKVRRPSQVKVLNSMGIEHKVRPDGSVAVLRSYVQKMFGDSERFTKTREAKPNWEALH